MAVAQPSARPRHLAPDRAPRLTDPEPVVWFSLDDGSAVGLRPIHPHDREQLLEGFAGLSEQSRFHRFLAPMAKLTEQQASYLTELDQVDHFAWGAGIPESGELRGIGVARYVRHQDDPEAAEIAVAVTDAYQGRGLGSLLVAALALVAAGHGIEVVTGFMHDENRAIVRIFERLGAAFERSAPGVVHARARLTAATPCPLDPEACRELIRIADRAAHPSAMQWTEE